MSVVVCCVQMAEFDGLVGMAFEALRYTTKYNMEQ